MGKTRSRIDKKNAVTFKLVHRSQKDPLIADESAPQRVLVECPPKERRGARTGADGDAEGGGDGHEGTEAVGDKIQEMRKFGIYFDDDYDYLQHLKEPQEMVTEWEPVVEKQQKGRSKPKIMLPSSLFASEVEEEEGMLNKGILPIGPQPDWDPELVAAMDEDFDFSDPENQIDDDFVTQALDGLLVEDNLEQNGGGDEDENEDVDDDEGESDVDSLEAHDDDDLDDHGLDKGSFSGEETKSHFTAYSMSSSVIRRNTNLTLLDQRFETLYEKEYANDDEIGARDIDDIEGPLDPNSEVVMQLAEEYKEQMAKKQMYETPNDPRLKRIPIERDEPIVEIELEDTSKHNKEDRFDCESVLSTYSTLYNHPKLIFEQRKPRKESKIRIDPKTGIPCGVLDKPGLTARKLKQLDESNLVANSESNDCQSNVSRMSRLSELSVRYKNETLEEKKVRKSLLKEYRRDRILERKANQQAFKDEDKRLVKEMMNLKNNLAGVKLL